MPPARLAVGKACNTNNLLFKHTVFSLVRKDSGLLPGGWDAGSPLPSNPFPSDRFFNKKYFIKKGSEPANALTHQPREKEATDCPCARPSLHSLPTSRSVTEPADRLVHQERFTAAAGRK